MTETTLHDYWMVLYRRRGLILTVAGSALAAAILLSMVLPGIYEVRTVFYVPAKQERVLITSAEGIRNMGQPVSFPVPDKDAQAPLVGILESRDIAARVHAAVPRKSLSSLLKKDVDIRVGSDYLIEIYVRDRDPELAMQTASAYPKVFDQFLAERAWANVAELRAALERRIASVKQELADAMKAKEAFQEQHGLISTDVQSQALTTKRQEFEVMLNNLQIEYEGNQKKIRGVQAQLAKEAGVVITSEPILTNPIIEELQKRLAEIEIRLAGLRTEFKEGGQPLVVAQQEYDQVKSMLAAEIAKIVKSPSKPVAVFYETLRQNLINLFIDAESYKAKIEGTKTVIAKLTADIQSLPKLMTGFGEVEREIARKEHLLNELSTNLEETKAQQDSSLQTVVIVENAAAPSRTTFPNVPLNAIVAGLMGLLAGVLYAFFIEYVEEVRRLEKLEMRELVASGVSEPR